MINPITAVDCATSDEQCAIYAKSNVEKCLADVSERRHEGHGADGMNMCRQ